MRTLSQLVLNMLLNAGWQVVLVAAVAALCCWLLRAAATNYQHLIWATALVLSPLLPLAAPLGKTIAIPEPQSRAARHQPATADEIELEQGLTSTSEPALPRLNRNLGMAVLLVVLAFLSFRLISLVLAWQRTRRIIRNAVPVALAGKLEEVIDKCHSVLGPTRATVLSSASIPVPITVGALAPLIILPATLLNEADSDVLT